MGGIAGITPGGDYVEPQLPRSTTVWSAATAGRYAEIPLKKYRKPTVPGLKHVYSSALRNPASPKLATVLDNNLCGWPAIWYPILHSVHRGVSSVRQ